MARDTFRDLLTNEFPNFINSAVLSKQQKKVLHNIYKCQTSLMGFNLESCPDCDYSAIHYNSCKDRHCPICQSVERELWIEKYQQLLLNVQYFHIVFTVPDSLHPIFLSNQKLLYDFLFKASAYALSFLSNTESFNYGNIGFSSILHTWGQNLSFHPHIHSIVTGGGLQDNHWISSKKNFFLPVQSLSKTFKSKFLKLIKSNRDKLVFPESLNHLNNDYDFDNFISSLFNKDWVVYTKKPFSSPDKVLEYIGRYSHRIAISPSRITNYDSSNHTVTFKYKDYKDHSKIKSMTLSVTEFLRRFSLHILPFRFVKIRHYGIMSNNSRKVSLPLARTLTDSPEPRPPSSKTEIIERLIGHKLGSCPNCGAKTTSSVIPKTTIIISPILSSQKHINSS